MDGMVDVKLLITLGGVAASVIGTAAVARAQIQRLTEQIKDVESQLRSADGRTDRLENNGDTQQQRVDILAGMLSPTKRETDARRSERLLTEVRKSLPKSIITSTRRLVRSDNGRQFVPPSILVSRRRKFSHGWAHVVSPARSRNRSLIIMLSLLGSVLGFGTSFLPKVMDYFQDRQDKAHELQLMDKQIEQQKALGEIKLQTINVEADIRESEALLKHDKAMMKSASTWMVTYAASVRPSIGYLLFLEFFILTYLLAFDMITLDLYQAIWSEPMQATFTTVVSFYYGSRSFNRRGHT